MMPDSGKKSTLSQLSTQELDTLIESISLEGEFNMAYLDALLAERRRRHDTMPKPDVRAAWTSLSQRLNTEDPAFPEYTGKQRAVAPSKVRKYRRSTLRKMVAVAAVVVLLSALVVAGAAGLPVIPQWDNDLFSFDSIRTSPESAERLPITFVDGHGEQLYDSVQQALDDYKITELSAPSWIPSGYELVEVVVYAYPEEESFRLFAAYSREDTEKVLTMEFSLTNDEQSGVQYSKSPGEPDAVEKDGLTYHQFANIDYNMVVWLTENFECSVGGVLPFDDIMKVALSTNID